MQTYYFSKVVNLEKLVKEIKHLPGYSYCVVGDSQLQIIFASPLTTVQEQELANLVNNHNPADPQKQVEAIIEDAMIFGNTLMKQFSAQNVLLGITQEGKTGEVLTKLAGVQLAVQAGSLYEAIARIRAIPSEEYDSKYITPARLLVFINQIEKYLGIPESTQL